MSKRNISQQIAAMALRAERRVDFKTLFASNQIAEALNNQFDEEGLVLILAAVYARVEQKRLQGEHIDCLREALVEQIQQLDGAIRDIEDAADAEERAADLAHSERRSGFHDTLFGGL